MGSSSVAPADLEVSPCRQVAPDERRDLVRRTRVDDDRLAEHRSGVYARMKFAALATRVDRRRQIAQQRAIELPAGEARIELTGIHAREPRAQAAVDHLLGKLARRDAPDGKERLEPGSRELVLAVAADVLEKQVAERDVREPVRPRVGDREAHLRFVYLVRARMRDVHDMQ